MLTVFSKLHYASTPTLAFILNKDCKKIVIIYSSTTEFADSSCKLVGDPLRGLHIIQRLELLELQCKHQLRVKRGSRPTAGMTYNQNVCLNKELLLGMKDSKLQANWYNIFINRFYQIQIQGKTETMCGMYIVRLNVDTLTIQVLARTIDQIFKNQLTTKQAKQDQCRGISATVKIHQDIR